MKYYLHIDSSFDSVVDFLKSMGSIPIGKRLGVFELNGETYHITDFEPLHNLLLSEKRIQITPLTGQQPFNLYNTLSKSLSKHFGDISLLTTPPG